MNRSPLKRTTPLTRKGWMRRKRPRRLSGPHADPARMGFVATLECVGVRCFGRVESATVVRRAPGFPVRLTLEHVGRPHRCEGRIEVCHEGRTGKGMGTRCPDSETIPMCTGLHRQWTEHRGWFAGWTKEQRREWAAARIAETTALYLSHGSRRG
jgi:hypothetical protein